MTQTTNYSLNLFETTDKMNPTTLNGLNANTTTIDTALGTIPSITYGTTDLTPGVSALTTGTFYFVYE